MPANMQGFYPVEEKRFGVGIMKIAITRLEGKEEEDGRRCASYGHESYRVSPVAARVVQERIDAFIAAADRGSFDCIFFTSALPAHLIVPRLRTYPRIIAIGPQTARIVERAGISCEILPHYYSRDFVPYLGAWIRGKHIGLPRADVPNDSLIRDIREAGGIPEEIRCYTLERTGVPLQTDDADAVLFTSAMSFRHAIWTRRPGLLIIAIGKVTAAAMKEGGVEPDVIGDGSLEGTLVALNRYLENHESQ
jgi:uroporphyrinogen-III synthase